MIGWNRTMKKPVDVIFPPCDPGEVPYFRLVLRGTSQLCFQSNELTGLFFLPAVPVASPIAFAYLLAAAIIAPGARMLLGEKRPVLATGLPGLNPCLIALSLPAFFQTGWTTEKQPDLTGSKKKRQTTSAQPTRHRRRIIREPPPVTQI
jgi:hypothetical protein